jgi:hypothetical protein
MKTIDLKEAFEILQDCSAIIIDDSRLIYPFLNEITGEDDNPFMDLSWEEDGEDFVLRFYEFYNKTVTVSGSSMFLYEENDERDSPTQITILEPKKLE